VIGRMRRLSRRPSSSWRKVVLVPIGDFAFVHGRLLASLSAAEALKHARARRRCAVPLRMARAARGTRIVLTTRFAWVDGRCGP
jgi:hypothetical protein